MVGKTVPHGGVALGIDHHAQAVRHHPALRRPAHQERTLARIAEWRRAVPDLALRSTFIVGFPGETERDFEILLQFIAEARLARVGCFKYEPVDGAPANDLPGAVPEAVKEERWHRFMSAQQAVSSEIMATRIGREIDVLIDEVDEEGAIGRSVWDAPDIDGSVFLNGETGLTPGELVRARVLHADEYDLWGERA